MTVGSLFSGIGGLDLGLEWAGFEPAWFCEIEEYPRRVLTRHWPEVPIIEDVRDVTRESVPRVDVVCGGFPCQDISWAGKGRGIDYDLSEQAGTRSGLWWEMWRVVRDLRPRYLIAENVSALTHRGLDVVPGSLAEIGYDAEWTVVSAASVGAPHIRERVFIVAYRNEPGLEGRGGIGERGGQRATRTSSPVSWFGGEWQQPWPVSFRGENMAYDYDEGLEGGVGGGLCGEGRAAVGVAEGSEDVGNAPHINAQGDGARTREPKTDIGERGAEHRGANRRANELERVAIVGDVRGVADGGSIRVDEGGVMWQTPTSDDGGRDGSAEDYRKYVEDGQTSGCRLRAQAAYRGMMWPTPTHQDGKQGAAPSQESRSYLSPTVRKRTDLDDTHGDWLYTDVPDRAARLKALGNAVVPQVAYLVGRAVRAHAEEMGWWR